MTKPSSGFCTLSTYRQHARFYPNCTGLVQPAVLFLLLALVLVPLSSCSEGEEAKRADTVSTPAVSTPSPPAPASTPTASAPPPMNAPEALFTAAERGDGEAVSQLLEAGVDVNAANTDGWTALMLAAHRGRIEVVTLLLNAGATVNTKSHDGSTPLMAATLPGHVGVVEALINAGANTSAENEVGMTALAIAQRNGHTEIVKLLAPNIRPTTEQVAEMQRLLTELGYDPGPIDGIWGPRTATAIRTYQQEVGLTVDVTVSQYLIAHARNLLEQEQLMEEEKLVEQNQEPEQGG